MLKSSASMYESLGSQFFRTTTGIKSEGDAFDESRFDMMFLTILGVAEICSFRLVLEWKIGKETPKLSRLKYLEKLLAKQGLNYLFEVLLWKFILSQHCKCWVNKNENI